MAMNYSSWPVEALQQALSSGQEPQAKQLVPSTNGTENDSDNFKVGFADKHVLLACRSIQPNTCDLWLSFVELQLGMQRVVGVQVFMYRIQYKRDLLFWNCRSWFESAPHFQGSCRWSMVAKTSDFILSKTFLQMYPILPMIVKKYGQRSYADVVHAGFETFWKHSTGGWVTAGHHTVRKPTIADEHRSCIDRQWTGTLLMKSEYMQPCSPMVTPYQSRSSPLISQPRTWLAAGVCNIPVHFRPRVWCGKPSSRGLWALS